MLSERKKRLGGASRLSITSLPSVDEVSGEEDTPTRTPRKLSTSASLTYDDLEITRDTSPPHESLHRRTPTATTSGVDRDQLCNAMSNLNTGDLDHNTFEHYERMVNSGEYVDEEEGGEQTEHTHYVPFEDLELIAEEGYSNDYEEQEDSHACPSHHSPPEFSYSDTGYHPSKVRRNLPLPVMHSLEDTTVNSGRVTELDYDAQESIHHHQGVVRADAERSSPEDEFFDASDDPLNVAFCDSILVSGWFPFYSLTCLQNPVHSGALHPTCFDFLSLWCCFVVGYALRETLLGLLECL